MAGCLGSVAPTGRAETTGAEPTTDDPTTTVESTASRSDLTSWERSTDCDGMHDSVIKVEWVASSIRDAFAPIEFSELPEAEQALLEPVVTEGGVGTCEPSDAFVRFSERVAEHWSEQNEDGDGPRVVALAYDGRYFGLYVEKDDEVYSA